MIKNIVCQVRPREWVLIQIQEETLMNCKHIIFHHKNNLIIKKQHIDNLK